MRKPFKRSALPALLCALILSGCGAPLAQYKLMGAGFFAAREGLFSRPDVNLKEKNNAAADYLIGRYKDQLSLHDDIIFKPLVELDNAGITSPFGLAVPEGIGLRFNELGYRVWIKDVTIEGNSALYPPPPANHTPKFVLTGTYAVQQKEVAVALRIINLKTSQVIAHFDYVMPVTKEIREMSKTEARIFRVKK